MLCRENRAMHYSRLIADDVIPRWESWHFTGLEVLSLLLVNAVFSFFSLLTVATSLVPSWNWIFVPTRHWNPFCQEIYSFVTVKDVTNDFASHYSTFIFRFHELDGYLIDKMLIQHHHVRVNEFISSVIQLVFLILFDSSRDSSCPEGRRTNTERSMYRGLSRDTTSEEQSQNHKGTI